MSSYSAVIFILLIYVCSFIVLLMLIIKNKRRKDRKLVKVFLLVLIVLTALAGSTVAVVPRMLKGEVSQEHEIFIPKGIAEIHKDGFNYFFGEGYEFWGFSLSDKEKSRISENIAAKTNWERLNKEEFDNISIVYNLNEDFTKVLDEQNIELNYTDSYIAIFDYSSNTFVTFDEIQNSVTHRESEDGVTVECYNVGGVVLLLIYDSSSGNYFAVRETID